MRHKPDPDTYTEPAPLTKSGEEARQGRPGRPVLNVLIAGTLLALAALLIVYLSSDGTT